MKEEFSDNIFICLELSKSQKTDKTEIVILGNIYNIHSQKINKEEIKTLYQVYGNKIYNQIDGTYTLVIIDYKNEKCFVFQDLLGFNQSIYFYKKGNYFYISNCMKKIITNVDNNFEIDVHSARCFLKKGYIPNSNTMIKSIKKIASKKYLEIDLKSFAVRQKIYKFNFKNTTGRVLPEIYNKVFETVCKSLIGREVSVTLSSGYDSNYILYTLKKNTEKKIDIFSIGGKIGRNEVPVAKMICTLYDNVVFHSEVVDDTSFQSFPEIVRILEGAIYESGIFLQYELAKLICKNKKADIFFGECADQVLDYEFYHPISAFINKVQYTIPKAIKKILWKINYKPYKDIYDMASYKVIKKNGIMMNYFGINCHYPFLRKAFLSVAKKAVIKGDKTKSFHKQVIISLLPDDIKELLIKIGGATELKTLFTGDIKLDDVKRVCERSQYYKEKKFDDQYYAIDYLLKIIYLELFERMFVSAPEIYLKKEASTFTLGHFFPELRR